MQTPSLQRSVPLQASSSPQSASMPRSGSGSGIGSPAHTPARQTSFSVPSSPSSQVWPSGRLCALQPEAAWPEQLSETRIKFDHYYAPIVVSTQLYFCSPRHDCVTALDTETGVTNWKFYADAPMRLAPAAGEGKLFCASDDGYLYCLNSTNGNLVWKFQGAPMARQGLGNKRLGSLWPVRGGR